MKARVIFLIWLLAAVLTLPVLAAEHGGKEHGGEEHAVKEHGGMEHEGKEHGGAEISEPSADEIRAAMRDYVASKSKEIGTFDVYDKKAGKTRKLSLIRIHERVGKTGNYYYSCADFRDTESQEMLDLDLDIEHKDGKLSAADVRIHKVSGKERYTYDADDNRIPVPD